MQVDVSAWLNDDEVACATMSTICVLIQENTKVVNMSSNEQASVRKRSYVALAWEGQLFRLYIRGCWRRRATGQAGKKGRGVPAACPMIGAPWRRW
jgi:hypothetical protein